MYSIIEVPFHGGMEEVASGKGPARLLRAGVDQILGHRGMPASVTHVRPRDLRSRDLDAVVDVNRMLRYAVKEAREQETIPVVLAGNCSAAIGILAGLDVPRLGVVWFDRHPDFHTPETSLSGNIEGMALAITVGHCYSEFRERIGMERAVEEQNVILGCFWDVESGERERLENSWISAHPSDSLGLLPVALHQLAQRVDAVYLHFDTDFLEGVEDPANFLNLVVESVPLAAVGVTNYNPDIDPGGAWEIAILKAVRGLNPRTQ